MENLKDGTLTLEHEYHIGERVEQHAFVTRYRGVQLPFEKPIWIKVYDRLEEEGGAELFERIESSTHLAHRLDRPGILRTLDYGELERHVPFVISERAHDSTLRDVVEASGPLETDRAIRLIGRVADVVGHAHDEGVCHGTLAPTWITFDDDVASAHVDHFAVGLTLQEMRRMEGATLTPDAVGAVPPEAFERDTDPPESDRSPLDDVTEAADVYALGTVAYYAMVGHHPFFGDDDLLDASEGIARVQNEDPRPLEQFGIDGAISDTVQRALDRDPDRRWSSPMAFAERLERAGGIGRGSTSQTSPPDERVSESIEREGRDRDGMARDRVPSEAAASGEGEPGPASTLVTLAIALLVVTNLAWFFNFMAGSSDSEATDAQTNKEEAYAATITSEPEGLETYRSDSERAIGQTPITFPASELNDDTPLELELRSDERSNTRLSLRHGTSGPTFRIHVPAHGETKAPTSDTSP